MAVTIEHDYSVVERTGAVAKLFFLRLRYAFQSNAIDTLKRSNAAWEKQYKELLQRYNERLSDRDVLEGIGVTRRPDGAWVFNFRMLLHNMTTEDVDDVKAALKDRCSLS